MVRYHHDRPVLLPPLCITYLPGTVDVLIEDPLGPAGTTIGTVEEVIDTAVWGAKMTFDVGDTECRTR